MTSSSAASAVDRETLRRAFDSRVEREARADFLLREAESRMLDRLSYIKLEPVARILDVGCGLGDACPALAARFTDAAFAGLDLSLASLRVASRAHATGRPRWWRRRPVRPEPAWVCGDAHRLPVADGSIDLLWSNLVAHWFDDPDAVAQEWRRVLRPGGLLMFSFLGVDTLRELASSNLAPPSATMPGPGPAGAAVASMAPAGTAYPDLHDWGDVLVRAGFADPVMDVERLTLTYADPIALARDAAAIRAGLPLSADARSDPAARQRSDHGSDARSDSAIDAGSMARSALAARLGPTSDARSSSMTDARSGSTSDARSGSTSDARSGAGAESDARSAVASARAATGMEVAMAALPPQGRVSVELVFGHAWRPLTERRRTRATSDDADQAMSSGSAAAIEPQPVRIVRRRESPFDA